jgi:hypothetical protein
MDGQYNEYDGKGRANFYKHQKTYEVDNIVYRSALYRYKNREQIPQNFIGRKTLRAPKDDTRMFDPKPMDGVYHAEDHMPILRTLPVQRKFS